MKTSEKKFLFILILLHLAVALPLAYTLNIWMDEGSTLYSTENGFVHTFYNAYRDEKQAPLYFLIVSLWRSVNDSIFFARLFSIVCSVLAIKFFYDLTRRVWQDKTSMYITALFAIHPHLFWASLEIRVYSLVILLSALLLLFFCDGYLDDEKELRRDTSDVPKRAQVYFILTAIFALYTNYYLGFMLAGCFIALLVLRRWQAAKTYFLQMLAVGVASLPLFWIVKQQFAGNLNGFVAEISFSEGFNIVWTRAYALVFPLELAPGGDLSIASLVRIWFVRLTIAGVVFFLIKEKFRNVGEKFIAFGTISAVLAAFLLAAYLLLGSRYVAFRHTIVWLVPLILFLGVVLTDVLPRKILIAFAIVFALVFPFSKIYKQYPNFAKRGDWARVAEHIEKNEKPGQPLIVFQTYEAITVPYHYKGVNKILPDERFFAFELEAEPGSENSFTKQFEFIISEIPPDAAEIWLLTDEICQTTKACQPLENFVEANYTVIETKDFYLERLRLLRKK